MTTDTPVFLHYTQKELDRNFDQRGWVSNAEAVIARYVSRSEATRRRLRGRLDMAYGPSPEERLDLFLAETSKAAPVLVFVHGGRWTTFTKDEHSFVADPFVPAGAHVAVLNFAKLPAVTMPQLVAQVRRGVEWVWRNAVSFGGDPRRLHIAGHSSGAHLAGMALATDWPSRGLPEAPLKGAALVSGPYDMIPVMHSARASYVKLSLEEIEAHSPLRLVDRFRCPVIVAWAEGDTDEFRRQSGELASAARSAGCLHASITVGGLNHFEIMEGLGDRESPVVRRLVALMGL